MTLASALGALAPTVMGAKCTVGELLSTLPEDDRLALVAAMRDLSISGRVIEKALRSEGLVVGSGAINRHRREGCKCCEIA